MSFKGYLWLNKYWPPLRNFSFRSYANNFFVGEKHGILYTNTLMPITNLKINSRLQQCKTN